MAGFMFAMLVVVVTWAVGIPRFASPDEPAHVFKAYGTAHGELLGAAAPGFPDNLREFDGPDSLGATESQRATSVSPTCRRRVRPRSRRRLISSAARYPPWYYGLVGHAGCRQSASRQSVFAYRLVSAILCVAC